MTGAGGTVGPRNLLTDVAGLKVGHAADPRARTGVTVVLADRPVVAGVDVRGGGPGTRETDVLEPTCLVETVDAIALAGGSAFGLDAAGGVTAWLAERGRGFEVGTARVPIVPGAILFDLLNGGDKGWGEEPPYRALAREACDQAAASFALGSHGAGLGAKAGELKGGIGSASFVLGRGAGRPPVTVAALAAVNPHGSVLMPASGVFWAWPFERRGEFGGRRPAAGAELPLLDDRLPDGMGANTTLVVVATDATLTKAEATRVAIMAHDGLARAIRPVHTPFDGDAVFVLATGEQPAGERLGDLARIGALAADCTARAIARGVYEADDLDPIRSYRSLFPDPPTCC